MSTLHSFFILVHLQSVPDRLSTPARYVQEQSTVSNQFCLEHCQSTLHAIVSMLARPLPGYQCHSVHDQHNSHCYCFPHMPLMAACQLFCCLIELAYFAAAKALKLANSSIAESSTSSNSHSSKRKLSFCSAWHSRQVRLYTLGMNDWHEA